MWAKRGHCFGTYWISYAVILYVIYNISPVSPSRVITNRRPSLALTPFTNLVYPGSSLALHSPLRLLLGIRLNGGDRPIALSVR